MFLSAANFLACLLNEGAAENEMNKIIFVIYVCRKANFNKRANSFEVIELHLIIYIWKNE